MRRCLRGVRILTMDTEYSVLEGDLCWEGDEIRSVGAPLAADEDIPGRGLTVLPGFVQSHVHLSQTIFRGLADDMPLLEWLSRRIWPLEAAHDEESLRLSVLLGAVELLRSGVTAILDMATVHHTEAAFRALAESGLRAVSGKVIMDGGPDGLREEPAAALRESLRLWERWEGAEGRLHYALSPRFALSVSEKLLRTIGTEADRRGIRIHTHAAEHPDEVAEVLRRHGRTNIAYLGETGILGPRTVVAHAVHLSPGEAELLAGTGTAVAHCPSANLKLGSGIADTVALRRRGVSVGIGSDGAPCNNRLDPFAEMRLAALLPKIKHGPAAAPAREVLAMATREGARLLGLEAEIGSLEVGKKADFIAVDLGGGHILPSPDPYSALVYAATPADVRLTVVAGRILYRDDALTHLDEAEILKAVPGVAERLRRRAGLPEIGT